MAGVPWGRSGRWVLLAALLAAGCDEAPIEAYAPRHPSESIQRQEVASFLAVVDALPGKKLPPMPALWTPAPRWSRSRALPVAELARREERLLAERSTVEWRSAHARRTPELDRQLRRQHMTHDQFVALAALLSLAVARDAVPPRRDLARLANRGRAMRYELARDDRLFASLSDEAAFAVQEQAAWLTIADRASRLAQLHPHNLTLAREFRQRLLAVLPPEVTRNPFDEFGPLLETRGVPFVEPPEGPSDDHFLLPELAGAAP